MSFGVESFRVKKNARKNATLPLHSGFLMLLDDRKQLKVLTYLNLSKQSITDSDGPCAK